MSSNNEFTLNAAGLGDYQSCRRKYMLSAWKPSRWRAKLLADACLRKGIVQLARGAKGTKVAADARAQFLLKAADPGLDMIGDPYREAKNWCALLEVVLRWMALQPLPQLKDVPPVKMDGFTWQVSAWGDDTGMLHRWITVDSWDADALSRELHSWRTIGDICATGLPMTLHVIELGQRRAGHHSAAWSRAFCNPGLASVRWKFIKPEDTKWKPVYFVDQRKMDAEEWVAAAEQERALTKLSHDVPVALPQPEQVADILRQMGLEATAMRTLVGDYSAQPMSRPACDLYVPCAYQQVCYSSDIVDLGKLNYVRAKEVRA